MGMATAKGLKYATGSFTVDKQYSGVHVVTHNLGTKKVFAFWWLESGTVYSTYNRSVIGSTVNFPDIVPSDYHQNFVNDTQYWDNANTTNGGILANRSDLGVSARIDPYTNYTDITDNDFPLHYNYYDIWIPGTYHWIVIALDDALNQEGGL